MIAATHLQGLVSALIHGVFNLVNGSATLKDENGEIDGNKSANITMHYRATK